MTISKQLRIEQATEDDIPLLLEFIHGLAQFEKLMDSVSVTDERLRASLFGSSRFAEAILAYQNDKAVGYAIYFFTYSSFTGLPGLYLEDLFVLPEWRGSGIGRNLLAFLAAKALERGCRRMEWAVLNWNEPAARFYKKLGAEPINDWTVFRLSEGTLEDLAGDL